MRKVIALWGRSKVGKTSTIRKVFTLLAKRYPDAQMSYFIEKAAEIRVVLNINGVKVGIESQGDPGGRLEESLELFKKIKCRIILCATRTRGATVEAVENLAPQYEVTWLEQVAVKGNEMDDSNRKMARQIVNKIDAALDTY